MQNLKKFFLLLFLITLSLHKVNAQTPNIKVGYTTQYILQKDSPDTRTKMTINIRNMKKDIYPTSFSIGIPTTFEISQIKATANDIPTEALVEKQDQYYRIKILIPDAKIGKGKENILTLEFIQKNLIKWQGHTWEAIFPTISRQDDNILYYNIQVVLPPDLPSKKISISKPIPTKIERNIIYWENVKDPVVYAVFGDKQIYKMDLLYELENTQYTPGYIYITLPPDSAYQQVVYSSIEPEPEDIKIDEDGNVLAKYTLKPKEAKEVSVKGWVILYPEPEDTMRRIEQKRFENQKKYLLTPVSYWQVNQQINLDQGKSVEEKAEDIFDFVVKTLEYNFDKLQQNQVKRLGANTALQQPNNAVCTEYTDLFIALSRKNNIYAREIQGFAITDNQRFRPLSPYIDILHTWPEYYDPQKKLWIPVDPTWEDTSKIDYFSSMDLNHIYLAIHGKDPEKPYPAGAFKRSKKKVIKFTPTDKSPNIRSSLRIFTPQNPLKIIANNKKNKINLILQNTGNTRIADKDIFLESPDLDVSPVKINIDYLAPFQKKELIINLSSNLKQKKSSSLILRYDSQEIIDIPVQIQPFWQVYLDIISKYWIFLTTSIMLITTPVYFFIKRKNE